jgi:hypothetical protein
VETKLAEISPLLYAIGGPEIIMILLVLLFLGAPVILIFLLVKFLTKPTPPPLPPAPHPQESFPEDPGKPLERVEPPDQY